MHPRRAAALGAALLLGAMPAAAGPLFRGLGDLPGGSFYSVANAVSPDGRHVAGYSVSDTVHPSGRSEAFVWDARNGMRGLGTLPDYLDGFATGVSADGSHVAGYTGGSGGPGYDGIRAVRWDAAGIHDLGELPGGSTSQIARGLSADGGWIVGEAVRPGVGKEAFRWSASGGMQGLGELPGGLVLSEAWAISADGATIVGQSHSGGCNEAFRWTEAGGMQGLGDLAGGACYSLAYAVSADGAFIAGAGSTAVNGPEDEAFLWDATNGMRGLGDLPGGQFRSLALGVSADGSAVVGYGDDADGPEAFLWTEAGGMQALADVLTARGLDLGGWDLWRATAISADGRTIVGWGTSPNGVEAFQAVIPEPGSAALLGLGLVALASRRRRS